MKQILMKGCNRRMNLISENYRVALLWKSFLHANLHVKDVSRQLSAQLDSTSTAIRSKALRMMRSVRVIWKYQIGVVLENGNTISERDCADYQVACHSSEGTRARADGLLPSRGGDVEPGRA